jgi:ATP-dependent RNA helicase SUPV3L1/SUV3
MTGFSVAAAAGYAAFQVSSKAEKQKKKLTIPFPEETLASPWPLDKLMLEWNRLPRSDVFVRADMSDPLFLYTHLKPYAKSADRKLLFRLITCPVDVKDEGLVFYWLSCCRCILANKPLPEPPSGTGTLEECETRYRELDIRHQLLRQIGIEEDRMDEKLELCRAINKFLKENKDEYLRRCRQCGRKLPATHPYGVCDRCFRESSDLASVYRRRGHSRR